MEIEIDTKNKQDRIIMLKILLGLGYKWHGEPDQEADDIVNRYQGYPIISVNTHNHYMCGQMRRTLEDECSFRFDTQLNEIVKILTESSITISGVGKYEAVVYRDKIEVGCTEISLEKFDEIAAAVKKMRK